MKIFLGLPGSETSGANYIDLDTLGKAVNGPIAKNNANFGGVMLWDASSSYENEGYVPGVAKIIGSPGASKYAGSRQVVFNGNASSASETSHSETPEAVAYSAASPSAPSDVVYYDAQEYTTPATESANTITDEPTVLPDTSSVPSDLTTLLTVYTSAAGDVFKRSNSLGHKHHQH
ncbi:unnamed protein product [Ambrosiozyma monospora]|uniref:Unnamed protein product n=1 Tax=Ambrosiozyma monospora TaxID=43982 RepID=A0ACB5T320_AMBMO|nr:unnamed protein product [Ambrosiozyma monospora]